MRLLLVGSDKVYAIENLYSGYLTELGVEVLHYPVQSKFYDYYQKSLFNKLIFKTGISSIFKRLNEEFKVHVEQFAPDVIFVFKGMELYPETLLWAKTKGCKLVNYNPDNPFIFSGKGSGNKNITKSIGHYDLHFTYNHEIKNELAARFPTVPVEILPFAFDIPDEVYKDSLQLNEMLRVCFLGNPDKFRANFIQRLAEAGVKLVVYGNYWEQFVHHSNIQVCGPVYGKEVWMMLRQYRVQLNLMRLHNLNSHNMRTFEVAGIGGIQLAPETADHLRFFCPGKEIFLFSDLTTCLRQIDYLMMLTKEEAEVIRKKVRRKAVSDGFDYRSRSKEVLAKLSCLISDR